MKTMIMMTRKLRLKIAYEDGTDDNRILIHAPETQSDQEVQAKILVKHNDMLDDIDGSDYGQYGVNYETLMEAVCREQNWTWEPDEPDIELTISDE